MPRAGDQPIGSTSFRAAMAWANGRAELGLCAVSSPESRRVAPAPDGSAKAADVFSPVTLRCARRQG